MSESLDLVAHKVRVRLNNKQASYIKDHCIASRLAYNFAIDRLRKPYMDYESCLDASDQPSKFSSRIEGAVQPALLDLKAVKFPSAFDVSKQWTIERDRLHPWMKARRLNMDTISGVFNNNYGAALKQWKAAKWNRDKMPTYHRRGAHQLSSTWRGRTLKQVDRRTFMLPGNMGSFKLGCPLRFDGEVRSVTFSEEGGKWYAAFLLKTQLPQLTPAPEGTAVGIDVGVVQFASFSNGEQYPPASDYQRDFDKLATLQRALSRMDGPIRGQRKASKNWLKQKQRIQKLHRHIANKRRYYTETITKDVSSRFQTVAIEDLKIKNMTRSAKGDSASPGKNVAQKSGLNRAILQGGLGMFRTRLEAKVAARKGEVMAVNPRYTSQTCNACGHVAKANRIDQATFKCVACGHTDNADINAAKNILFRALTGAEPTEPSPSDDVKESEQQGTSTPVSLLTKPVTVLAQEAVKQDAPSRPPFCEGEVVCLDNQRLAIRRKKRVNRVNQIDFFFASTA